MFLLNVGHGEICIHVRLKEHVVLMFPQWRGKEKRKINTRRSLYFKPAEMLRSDSSYLNKCFLTQWPESITFVLKCHTHYPGWEMHDHMTTGDRKICKNEASVNDMRNTLFKCIIENYSKCELCDIWKTLCLHTVTAHLILVYIRK